MIESELSRAADDVGALYTATYKAGQFVLGDPRILRYTHERGLFREWELMVDSHPAYAFEIDQPRRVLETVHVRGRKPYIGLYFDDLQDSHTRRFLSTLLEVRGKIDLTAEADFDLGVNYETEAFEIRQSILDHRSADILDLGLIDAVRLYLQGHLKTERQADKTSATLLAEMGLGGNTCSILKHSGFSTVEELVSACGIIRDDRAIGLEGLARRLRRPPGDNLGPKSRKNILEKIPGIAP